MLKTIFSLALSLTCFVCHVVAQSNAPQTGTAPTAPVNVVLQDGTAVKLRLGATAAANGVRVGETLQLEVVEDVRLGDVVVIAKGSTASAAVTNLRSGGNVKGGWIDINLDSVSLSDGERVPIRSSKQRMERSDESNIVSSQAQDASIAQGADLTAFINGNKQLDLTRLRAAGGPSTTLKITSSPSNAEVTLDGHLAGSTPNTVRVTSGDHVVLVRMAGFQSSQRKIHVQGEPVALDIPLSKQDGAEAAPVTKPVEASLGDLARAARARKQAPTITPVVLEQDGAAPVPNQTGQRDPMQARTPKK
jgi:PEGA domain